MSKETFSMQQYSWLQWWKWWNELWWVFKESYFLFLNINFSVELRFILTFAFQKIGSVSLMNSSVHQSDVFLYYHSVTGNQIVKVTWMNETVKVTISNILVMNEFDVAICPCSFWNSCFADSCGNDEYFCPEGWCIPLTQRCDGMSDCANGEDEQLCGLYI